MKKYKVSDWKIRGAIHALVFEVLRRQNILDKYIYVSLKTKSSYAKLDPKLKNILRIGTYEIKFLEKSAGLVTNELVNITKQALPNPKKESRFINALLYKVEKTQASEFLEGLPLYERLSLEYFYPTWYVKYLFYLFLKLRFHVGENYICFVCALLDNETFSHFPKNRRGDVVLD